MSLFGRSSLHPGDRGQLTAASGSSYRLWRPIWSGSTGARIELFTLLLWLGLFTVELIASIALCDGRLVFTLDDPYIHLAVADHILSGGYGVNGSEFSSPSSSIVWPYLLALTEALRLGAIGPLLINALAAAAAVTAFLRCLEAAGLFDGETLLAVSVPILAILATSAIALPMTGMEHSLHVWASIVTFAGLAQAARGRAPTPVHFAALVLLPLIRFEGAAFALAAIAAFALLGHRRFAALAATVIVCALGANVASMTWRGLPLLPSSVLLKSQIAETAYEGSSAFASILHNLNASIGNPYGGRLTLLGLALAWGTWLLRADAKPRTVCIAVLLAVAAHLAFGQYDWFHRYEVYIIALAALALLYAAPHLKPVLGARQWIAAKLGIVLLIGLCSEPYLFAAIDTPSAARSVYEQQYQMGLFARSVYGRPVAVNDLGLVAYGNANFVLDLWGLGSERVRKAKLAGRYGPEDMAALADEYHVGVAMIYDSWFPRGVPPGWTKVAVLHTHPVAAAAGDVAFYMTPAADAGEVARALTVFKSQLPPRDTLEMVAR